MCSTRKVGDWSSAQGAGSSPARAWMGSQRRARGEGARARLARVARARTYVRTKSHWECSRARTHTHAHTHSLRETPHAATTAYNTNIAAPNIRASHADATDGSAARGETRGAAPRAPRRAPHERSPRMRRASCMSLGWIVTRFAWIAHRFVSSKRPTRYACARAACDGRARGDLKTLRRGTTPPTPPAARAPPVTGTAGQSCTPARSRARGAGTGASGSAAPSTSGTGGSRAARPFRGGTYHARVGPPPAHAGRAAARPRYTHCFTPAQHGTRRRRSARPRARASARPRAPPPRAARATKRMRVDAPVRLLHAADDRGALARGLGGQRLARRLPTRGLACRLLRARPATTSPLSYPYTVSVRAPRARPRARTRLQIHPK